MTTNDILKAARELLTPKGAWTQWDYARDKNGMSVPSSQDEAKCFCLLGAILRVSRESGCLVGLTKVEAKLSKVVGNYIDWNDAPGRTQQEVLDLLDKVIEA